MAFTVYAFKTFEAGFPHAIFVAKIMAIITALSRSAGVFIDLAFCTFAVFDAFGRCIAFEPDASLTYMRTILIASVILTFSIEAFYTITKMAEFLVAISLILAELCPGLT